jgi:membrane fusion protein, multidrug efflux system
MQKVRGYINFIVGFSLLGVAVGLWAMPSEPDATPAGQQRREHYMRVVLDSVQRIDSQRSVRFAGTTQAKDRAVLSFAVPARVAERSVESGSRVHAGDVLARLDDREYRNARKLAQASLNELNAQWQQAGRDRRRIEKLTADNVASVSDLEKAVTREDALKASAQAAEARLAEADRLLQETVLKAPFDGTVTDLDIQAGEWAAPGQPAVELTGDGPVELVVEVPESVVLHIESGQQVTVVLPFDDNREVSGRIVTVAKAAISAGRLFPVKVLLDENQTTVRAGMTAQLLVNLPMENALTVPLAAVVNPGASRPFLFTYADGQVTKKVIRVNRIVEDRIVVKGALVEGDNVVISGQSQLSDGDVVEVAP